VSSTLSAPAARELNHTRRIEIACYMRADGLWDIEGRMVDVRPTAYYDLEQPRAPNEPIHDMWLRLTIDGDFNVLKSEAAMPAGAYDHCPLVLPNYSRLEGLRIGPGWNKAARERLGGVQGCTHLVEMLAQMASAAMQAVWNQLSEDDPERGDALGIATINTCYAYRSDGRLVARKWPDRYTGRGADNAAE
jgi:hypothetical protein